MMLAVVVTGAYVAAGPPLGMALRHETAGVAMKPLVRWLLISAGLGCVALGVIGIFLPLMPTTPFLLLAAYFFSKSSPRFLHWLLHNRWFGSYIRNYREGRGMPLRAKIVTLGLMWVTMGVTAYFVPLWWVRGVLLAVAMGVTAYVGGRLRTMPAAEAAGEASVVAQTTPAILVEELPVAPVAPAGEAP